MKKLLAALRTSFIIVAICAPLVFAVGTVAIFNRIDTKDNATRCRVVALVQLVTESSYRSAQATLKSSTATKAQKEVATRNVAAFTLFRNQTEEVLGHPHGAACPP